MKKIKKVFMTIGLSAFLVLVSGCGKEVTITFVSDGETYHSVTLKGKDNVNLPSTPSKKGYEFKGWYFDEEYNRRFSSDYYTKNEINDDVSLYARLELIQYQISYNLSGGVNNGGNPNSYNVNDTEITLLTPYRNGYRFMGWYSEQSYTNKITKIDPSTCANINLYAKWLKIYNIEYVVDGGVNNVNNPVEYVNEGKNIVLLDPTKDGEGFLGWYKEPTFDNKVTEIDISESRDLTLYAKWVRSYSINYVCGIEECSIGENKTSYVTGEENITLLPASHSNYRFDGWYADAEFENTITEIDTSVESNVTVYAKWTRINTINYDLNEGENHSSNPTSYLKGDSPITLFEPTRKGYNFLGWYKEAMLINKVEVVDTSVSGDITLHAGWELIPYEINYDLNEGDSNNIANPQAYTIASDDIVLLNPNREGYTFLGWYTDATYETKVEKIEKGTIGDISLIAKWELTSYTITYHLDGGTNNYGNPDGYNVNTPDITLLDPEKRGYTFLGWYIDESYTHKYTPPANDKENLGNLDFYAKWELIEYSITFNPDGGKINGETTYSHTYSVNDYYVPFYTPIKEGYTFKGWYTDKSYTTKVESITDLDIGNFVLVANWSLDEYEILYYLNEGENHPDNPTKYSVETEVVIKDPTRRGYEFKGWYTDNTFTELQKIPQRDDKITYVFFAKWEIIDYTIALDANGGSIFGEESYQYTYTVEQNVTLYTPIKEGSEFKGWYKKDNLEEKVETVELGSIGDLNLVAKWELIKYKLIYHLDGGENHPDNPQTYTIQEIMPILDPTKKGYKFLGWFTDDSCEELAEINLGDAKDNDLYAGWEIINYTLSLDANGGLIDGVPEKEYSFTINTIHDGYLPSPDYRSGYTFLGWYTDTTYETKVEAIEDGTIGDITLIAKWNIEVYNITYELNGGENHPDNPSTYSIGSNVSIKNPTKEGYEFEGWCTTNACSQYQDATLSNDVGDQTFYAKWSIIKYTITYDINLLQREPIINEYTIEDEVLLQDFSISGYTFLGWYTDTTYETKVEVIEKGSTGDVNVVAKWQIETYTITYELDGGENHPDNLNTYTIESEFELKDPTKEGYNFGGWYADSEFTTEVDMILGEYEDDITIYAKWEPINE